MKLFVFFFSFGFWQKVSNRIGKNNANSTLTQGDDRGDESDADFSGDEESFYQRLLDCCLSASNLLALINKGEQLQYFYQGKPFGHFPKTVHRLSIF